MLVVAIQQNNLDIAKWLQKACTIGGDMVRQLYVIVSRHDPSRPSEITCDDFQRIDDDSWRQWIDSISDNTVTIETLMRTRDELRILLDESVDGS